MRTHVRLFMVTLALIALASLGTATLAQEVVVNPAPHGMPGEDKTIVFVSSEMSLDGKIVKGAPYSAQAITETTRTLSDGNRIRHKTTATVYRDKEGRTRREHELGAVGPWAMAGEPHQSVFINDPVSGINYTLDPKTKTARKMAPFRIKLPPGEGPSIEAPGIAINAGPNVKMKIERDVFTAPALPPGHDGGGRMFEFHVAPRARKGTTESLGKQAIEGVEAEGTRTTTTIPAGEVGNEQPINIVTEKWYSPELQTVVMLKTSDPFVGETVYRLTGIDRSEPAASLFQVPGDYTVKEMPLRNRVTRKIKPGELE